MPNAKEVVNLQGLLVLIVGYVDMITYPLTKYYFIIERVYFIYRLLILFISTLSFLLFLYSVSWRYKSDYLHASKDILFYIMFYIINTMKKHYTLLYHFVLTTQKRSQFEHGPQPTISSYAPTLFVLRMNKRALY